MKSWDWHCYEVLADNRFLMLTLYRELGFDLDYTRQPQTLIKLMVIYTTRRR